MEDTTPNVVSDSCLNLTPELTLDTYQNSIRQILNGCISIHTLTSAIISLFGTGIGCENKYPRITDKQSGNSMSHDEFESILELLLTKDGKDMAIAVSSDQSFIEKGLFFEYDTVSGKGYIVESETKNRMVLN